MTKIAGFFIAEQDNRIRCGLCPHHCIISNGHFGFCGVRGNKNGNGILPYYGSITALALDPIEKKPLYHFRPGTMILSIGFFGCNMHCPFCQNWHISQASAYEKQTIPLKQMLPGDIVSAALHNNVTAIAYTYSEPLVHAEFLLECMELARSHGIANVLVSNGCIDSQPAEELLSLTDAANIDLKCFSQKTYSQTLGGGALSLETVQSFIRLAYSKKIHIEITTLIVPGLNDSIDELDACAGFIAEMDLPWHLSSYHPDYRWNAPPVDPAFMLEFKKRAQKKISHVYIGNIPGEVNNTACSNCGTVLIRRRGYAIDVSGLASPVEGEKMCRCKKCGFPTVVTL